MKFLGSVNVIFMSALIIPPGKSALKISAFIIPPGKSALNLSRGVAPSYLRLAFIEFVSCNYMVAKNLAVKLI